MATNPQIYLQFHTMFSEFYGTRAWRPGRNGLDECVLTVLSQSTTDRNSGRAFVALRSAYPTWEAVRAATPAALAATIRVAGLADDKARRIQAILRHPEVLAAGDSLDFLAAWSVADGLTWLTAFHGVGRKTAACVLLFAYGKEVLPVDTHIARVAYRLGLTTSQNPEHAHRVLNACIPPALHYAAHMHLIQHGRRVCHARNPGCESCFLRTVCPAAGHR